MAWTTPRTWVAAEVPTAANMNTHIRDNFNTLSPAVVTTVGDVVYATAGSALTRLGSGSPYQALKLNTGATAPTWSNEYHAPLDVVTVDSEVVANAAETTLWTSPDIGQNLLTTNGSLRLEFRLDYLNNTGATQTFSLRLKLDGASVFMPFNLASHATGAVRRQAWVRYALIQNNSASIQTHSIEFQSNNGIISAASTSTSYRSMTASTTVDMSTGEHLLTITGDHGAANSLLSCVVKDVALYFLRRT